MFVCLDKEQFWVTAEEIAKKSHTKSRLATAITNCVAATNAPAPANGDKQLPKAA